MVTRSISPERFESFFSTILLPDSALALLHRDGSLLVGYPQTDEVTAKRFIDSPLLAQASTDGYATLQIESLVDGQLDLASASSLEHYPIYVVATRMSSAALAGWRRETQTLVLAALLVPGIIAG
jgi:hypothetical protein